MYSIPVSAVIHRVKIDFHFYANSNQMKETEHSRIGGSLFQIGRTQIVDSGTYTNVDGLV